MDTLDLAPATAALAALLQSLGDDDLCLRTPCPAYAVGDLVDHVGGLSQAFVAAARKTPLGGDGNASGDASRLEDGWRARIAGDLDALARAWADPAAYEGMTQAGPIELPAPVAGLVAFNEVVVHGWDLAAATGRSFDPGADAIAACTGFVSSFEVPDEVPHGEGPFGPPVEPPADATDLERLAALAGRDPRWSPA